MNIKNSNIDRRVFIKKTALAATALTLTGKAAFSSKPLPVKNLLPKWRGFNLLDFFSPNPPRNSGGNKTTEDDLRWMADWGFDFVQDTYSLSPVPLI